MSNISNTHNVVPFTSGVTKAFTGQRLATVTYKTDSKTGVKKDSKAVSVPTLAYADIESRLSDVKDSILSLFIRAQDGIVREIVESGSSVVQDSDISVDAIVSYLNDSSESGRLTKESLNIWFDSNVADILTVRISDILGVSDTPTDADVAKIEKLVASYKSNISALAGGKTSYSVKVAKSLQDAIVLADTNDSVSEKLVARLVKMQVIEEVSLIDLL